MIISATYTLDWITAVRNKLGRKVDPKMIEKVINALVLLEGLRVNGINLIFKGGTSLLLTSQSPTRFSIDIDIITQHQDTDIQDALDKIVGNSLFTRWEPDNDRKTAPEAPVTHYKTYYESKVDKSFGEEPILLDVLHTDNPYPKIFECAIEHSWLQTEGEPVLVNIPVHDCILGDKLTAFAPKTTGILYTKDRPVEIIKQLYDISYLFDQIENIHLVKESYRRIVAEELSYRMLDLSYRDVLNDTIEACLVLASKDENKEEFKHLRKGVINITNFIINRFKIEEATTAASKVAYLSMVLKNDQDTAIQKFQSPEEIRDLSINNKEYHWLNKLKKSNPEAFFYWEKALAIET